MSGTRLPPIGTATAADLPRLLTLIHSAYRGESSRRGWTTEADLLGGSRTDAELLAAELANPATTMLVVEDGHGLLGCCALTLGGSGQRDGSAQRDGSGQRDGHESDAAYFGTFAVRPDAQGRGVGSHLLAAAEARARAAGATRLQMAVIAQRDDLLAWYARRGYAPTGETRPFPYGDERYGRPRRNDLAFTIIAAPLHRRR